MGQKTPPHIYLNTKIKINMQINKNKKYIKNILMPICLHYRKTARGLSFIKVGLIGAHASACMYVVCIHVSVHVLYV